MVRDPAPGIQHTDTSVGPSTSEELANTVTHGIGFLLSLAGAAVLMDAASTRSEPWLVRACGIYVTTLVAVYAMSTLSHAIQEPRLRRSFRTFDQAAIFLLCAGNFTPFALAYTCRGPWWLVLAAMWTIALIGFVSKILWKHRTDAVSISVYVLLGWVPVLSAKPALQNAPLGAIVWIVLGGFCYMIGTAFLVRDERRPSFHAIWHVFVIAGSCCHFIVVLKYVVL